MDVKPDEVPAAGRRYKWPWFVAILVLLGIALAVITVKREAQRIREQRQYDFAPATR